MEEDARRRRLTRRSAPAVPEDEIEALSDLIRSASHVVFVTGAGISTNAGLRDYRGPQGIWTEARAKGLVQGEPGELKRGQTRVDTPWDDVFYSTMPRVTPTKTHAAITKLVECGLVKHVISQNEDGLHLRAGLQASRLSEVHGNAFIEICSAPDRDTPSEVRRQRGSSSSSSSSSANSANSSSSSSEDSDPEETVREQRETAAARARRPAGCGAAIPRAFVTYYKDTYKRSNPAGPHVTGRACPRCRRRRDGSEGASSAEEGADGGGSSTDGGRSGGGWLLDTTVDFGEAPDGFPWGANPVHKMALAIEHMRRADLVVAWGSSMSILANYFDPWCPTSAWARPPKRLGPEPPPLLAGRDAGAGASAADGAPTTTGTGSSDGEAGKRKRVPAAADAAATAKNMAPSGRPCKLAIVNKGKTTDQQYASLKIKSDVDAVSEALLAALGLPPAPEYDVARDPFVASVVPVPPDEEALSPPWAIQ